MFKMVSMTLILIITSLNWFTIPSEENTNIIDSIILEGNEIQYGSYYYLGNVEGIIIINTDNENDIPKVIFNRGQNTDVIQYIAYIDDTYFLAVCVSTIEVTRSDSIFQKMSIIKYSYKGVEQDRIELLTKPLTFYNHDNALVVIQEDLSYFYVDSELNVLDKLTIDFDYEYAYTNFFQGNAMVNDLPVDDIYITDPGSYKITFNNEEYYYEYIIHIHPVVDISGDMYYENYIGDVLVKHNGFFYINNQEYEDEAILKTPGNYCIKVTGENNYIYEQTILIYPIITFFDGQTTNQFVNNMDMFQEISIFSNGISMFLNDKMYESNVISETGKYHLSVYGINDMVYHLDFNIYPYVLGLEDIDEKHNLSLEIFGEGMLNGERVTKEVTISESGSYQLDLLFENEVFKTYEFTMNIEQNDAEEQNDFSTYIGYGFIAISVIGTFIILRKK